MSRNQTTFDAFDTARPTHLSIGDRVVDEQGTANETADGEDDPSTAIVLNVTETPAADHSITVEGETTTIAELNPDFPKTDPVITVVFKPFLDKHVSEWEQWNPREFPSKLQAYSDEWNIRVQTYHYPASRLQTVTET